METIRKLCEFLVHYLPLPSHRNKLYFQIHCQLAAWAMFLGESNETIETQTGGPF